MPTATIRPADPRHVAMRPRAGQPAKGAGKRASYTVNSRARVLFTLSHEGVSKLIDVPAEFYELAASGLATSDTFIVEPRLHDNDAAELEAIVTDYLQQAAIHARVPMTFSRLGDFLAALTY